MRALLLCVLVLVSELAQSSPEVLPVDQAFRYETAIAPNGDLLIRWTVDGCCYLYRDKFRFTSLTSGVELGSPGYPQAERKHDEFLGDTWIYRGSAEIAIPLLRANATAGDAAIELAFQGCADQGICYPPQKRTIALPRADGLQPAVTGSGMIQSFDRLAKAFQDLTGRTGSPELLPAEQAFRFSAEVAGPRLIRVGWQIADGYYLYREKFKLGLNGSAGVRLGVYEVPRGEPRLDEEFGAVEVFHHEVGFMVPLLRDGAAGSVRLEVGFQGCADRGVCYPPMNRQVMLDLPAIATDAGGEPLPEVSGRPVARRLVAEHDRIAATLHGPSVGLTLLSFLGFGLLLAFTPCMFPMIPILSGIIIGQGHPITTSRAFLLSLSYVVASALTYTGFGVLAGLFGSNLQALFQAPWIVGSFSVVFVLLALSTFGFFQLQFPSFIQSRIAAVSSKQQRGSLSGAAIMGALSALVMGPCVAPPLAGALIYIGQSGDAWLGGAALFALGFGMGIPLLVIGTSAGKLLPKVGLWMNAVKGFFGVGLLAVAVWLLERIVPPAVALFLWALLLIIPAIYLGALDALPQPASGWRKLWKGVGVVMLVYGVLLLLGVATDGRDPLQPLRDFGGSGPQQPANAGLTFDRVRSLDDLEQRLSQAQEQGRWVMLDYYADWCVSCKEMERYTFADPLVKAALANIVLLQADVSENSDDDQALLKRFGLIGPPATLFFGPDRDERPGLRVVGYLDPERFLDHLRRVPSCLLEC